MNKTWFNRATCGALSIVIAIFFSVSPLHALTTGPATAKVTFTFDDARASTYTTAAPILAKNGLTGTLYVTTGCVGMITIPNNCRAADDVKYMTWAQITSMQNTYGWEIGSHSVTHPYMASTDAGDGQPNMLTAEQIEYEVSQSKRDLASHGINANSFASPYGDYSMYTLQVIEKYYTSHRAFRDTGNNVYPYNDLLLNNMQVQYPVTLAAVKAKVDDAIAHNYWLVLTFHDIRLVPSNNLYKYQWGSANFNALASYVKLKQDEGKLKNTNVSQGLVSGTRNLLPVAVVNNRLSNGWSTDRPLSFTPSTSLIVAKYVSESATSLRATGGVTAGHLFSPKTAVTHGSSYVIKSYLNVQSITKGEIGYYIDEYDASGNWVSGQFKTMESSIYTEKINFAYQPSSQIVKSASLQIYITNGSDVLASVDDFEWYVVDESTSPVVANLMPNGSFETGLNNGWSTDDSAAIRLDQAGNGSGSSPSSSVAFSKTSGTAHLFSPILSIVANQRYYFEHYLNIVAKTEGEIGVYIDEFDANGNWISGQYKITSTTLGKQTVQYAYTPSSSSVTSVREQFIFHAPGSISGYIDDIRMSTL